VVSEMFRHKVTLESRIWEKRGTDYINPNRRPIENDENTRTILLGKSMEKRLNVAKCNTKSGIIILNQEANKHISGLKKYRNEAKITIVFRGTKIAPIEKIYLLHYSYLPSLGMMIDDFKEYNEKDNLS
jgi:hypothetical protein